MKRISLTEEDFIELLKGNVIDIDGVEIALEDIGYYKIVNALIKHVKNEN